MVIPLVILAVLSFTGGWVGIGGRFDKFLEPVFSSHATPGTYAAETPAAEKISEATEGGHKEELLMGISVAAAFLGLYLAWLLYYQRKDIPGKIAASLGSFYEAVVHKYYIDELYATLFVKPLIDGSRLILWQGVDKNIIDAAVNNTADGAKHLSDEVRHMQSGNIRSYAGWVAAGAGLVTAYMIWMGVR